MITRGCRTWGCEMAAKPSEVIAGGSGSLRKRLQSVATLQGIALIFSGALLGGGETTKLLAVALIPYWYAAALIVSRRRQSPTRSDRYVILCLYPMLFIAAFLWQNCRWA